VIPFGVAIICLAVTLVLAFLLRRQVGVGNISLPRWAALVPLGLAVPLLVLSMTTVVDTRNIGVVTTFNRPTGETLSNGLHMKAPWEKVTEIDGTIITDEFAGDTCIVVRIGDGSNACVSETIRWRIVPQAGDELFADYRSDDVNQTIADALVETQLTSATASVFSDFNPLLQAGAADQVAAQSAGAPDLNRFSEELSVTMNDRLREMSPTGQPQVAIQSITISRLNLSASTQRKINALQEEVANTRIAQQRQATAQAQAAANQALAASVSNNPEVLVSRCIDWLEETDQEIPAGFSCWPGAGQALVLPSTQR
jgi:regulator of protease activity HflC (stomatin/prohibitin superfamily)